MGVGQQHNYELIKEVGFDAIVAMACSSLGLPPFGQIAVTSSISLAKSYLEDRVKPLYDDFSDRQLSKFQLERLKNITFQAITTFCKRCKVDDWNIEHPESDAYIKFLFESQDHLIYQSLQDAQRQKDILYVSYWGNLIYEHDENWDDQYFIINLLGRLSIRQIILIRLLVDGFPGINTSLAITNPIIVSEFNDLSPLFWHIEKGIELNNSWESRHLGNLVVTDFAKNIYTMLDLSECFTEEMIKEITLQMKLQSTESPHHLYIDPDGNYAERPPFE